MPRDLFKWTVIKCFLIHFISNVFIAGAAKKVLTLLRSNIYIQLIKQKKIKQTEQIYLSLHYLLLYVSEQRSTIK